MDSFHIILEIASTTLTMKKFSFVAPKTHKKFNCSNSSTCKVEQFIEKLNKTLAADNDYEEMWSKFIEASFKCKNIFSCLYKVNLSENVDTVNKVQELTDDITGLREKEAKLVTELMNIRQKKKGKLKNSYINCLQIFLSDILLLF